MADKIIIDDIDFTPDIIDGLDGLEFEFGLVDKSYSYSTSTGITLSKKGFDYLQEKFFSSCTDIANKCKVAYFNCCCKQWFNLDITWSEVTICPTKCQAEVELVQQSSESSCYNYLCNRFIGDDGYAEKATLYKYRYNVDRGLMQRFLLVLTPILTLFAIVLTILFDLLAILCPVVKLQVQILLATLGAVGASIPGVRELREKVGKLDCPKPIDFKTIPCALSEFVGGTGNFHTGIKLKEVFEYYAAQCGAEFCSPIFDHPDYRHLGILLSTNTEQNEGDTPRFIRENVPTKTIKGLLDELAENVFNADWIFKTVGGKTKLHFDRKDKIDALRVPLTTWTDILERIEEHPCVSFCEDGNYANIKFSYCEGDIPSKWVSACFNGRIDWNKEKADWKRGTKEIQSSCFNAAIRHQFDQSVETDGSAKWRLSLDLFRAGKVLKSLTVSPTIAALSALSGAIGLIASLIVCRNTQKYAPTFGGDVTNCVPLLIFDPNSPQDDTTTLKRDTGRKLNGETIWDYNYPLQFAKVDTINETVTPGQLYDEYWIFCDPDRTGRNLYELSSLKYTLTCDEFSRLNQPNCGYYIDTPYGRANIDLVRVEAEGLSVDVDTAKIRCQ